MRTRIHHLVVEQATSRGDGVALSYGQATRSYAELWDDIRRVAAGIAAAGIGRGDRVAVYLDKRIETVVAIFAASAAGAAFVPINPLLRPQQVAHILADSQARMLVTSAERATQLGATLTGCSALDHLVVVGDVEDVHAAPAQQTRIAEWGELAAEGGAPAPDGVDGDLAAILYTSGSTGLPKGVVLSHRNLLVGAESVSSYLHNAPSDVILSVLPLSFDAGLSQVTTGCCVGAHVVLMNYLLPRDVVRLCARQRVTGLTCVPPLWIQLAEQEWPAEATTSLRYFANTGGRMPKTTLDRLRAIFPAAAPYLMYGLTEAFRSTYLDPAEVDRRPDSIGRAIPNAEILVVRPDGTPCDAGEEGELVHRGPLVALGYWNDPERTAARFRPAPGRPGGVAITEIAVWSGDTVVRDEEGFLYFVGRADEMIKTSGYRVSPTEIEDAAYDTGLVRDAVALGVDDAELGQQIVLAVTGLTAEPPDVDAVVGALATRLPRYMVPRTVLVRDELPRSPNGKFDRVRIRSEL